MLNQNDARIDGIKWLAPKVPRLPLLTLIYKKTTTTIQNNKKEKIKNEKS